MSLRLILLGPPASGKGTQGRRLAEDLGLDYLSTGALLREAMEEGSAAGEEARPYLERGDYVPDALMQPLVERWLGERQGGWILDGYPRTLAQDDALRAWLRGQGGRLDGVIELQVPKQELVRRIERRVECPECRWSGQRGELNGAGRCPECGGLAGPRADDTLDNFLSRHEQFVRHTMPIIERYAADDRLFSCDATAPVDAVAERLLAISERLKRHGQAA